MCLLCSHANTIGDSVQIVGTTLLWLLFLEMFVSHGAISSTVLFWYHRESYREEGESAGIRSHFTGLIWSQDLMWIGATSKYGSTSNAKSHLETFFIFMRDNSSTIHRCPSIRPLPVVSGGVNTSGRKTIISLIQIAFSQATSLKSVHNEQRPGSGRSDTQPRDEDSRERCGRLAKREDD